MEITDRSKDVIKSGGEWISSITLENIALSHPDVAEAAVIAAHHPKWDERPLLLVVPRAGRAIDPADVLRVYADKVPKWWLPDAVVVVAELPHTATGKLLKTALRSPLPRPPDRRVNESKLGASPEPHQGALPPGPPPRQRPLDSMTGGGQGKGRLGEAKGAVRHAGRRPFASPSRPLPLLTLPVKGSKGSALGGVPRGSAPWWGLGRSPSLASLPPIALVRRRSGTVAESF